MSPLSTKWVIMNPRKGVNFGTDIGSMCRRMSTDSENGTQYNLHFFFYSSCSGCVLFGRNGSFIKGSPSNRNWGWQKQVTGDRYRPIGQFNIREWQWPEWEELFVFVFVFILFNGIFCFILDVLFGPLLFHFRWVLNAIFSDFLTFVPNFWWKTNWAIVYIAMALKDGFVWGKYLFEI